MMTTQKTSSDQEALDGFYELYETIGSGGFAKVKRGVHVLTGGSVAIKIMDKKALKKDLPRVKTEINALKHLCHQNIGRLYEVIETERKYFLVLEYCTGGELFDYIVKKDGLPEPEARHFFRQIVAAVVFVHEQGFAHRDLKPENLLLTDDLRLKLIDFGLCAKPEYGLQDSLNTCCGSPAYAAPEIISGKAYYGNETDVWSMGVLLYTLLCGCLPFDDDNITAMYRKIQANIFILLFLYSGQYKEPTDVSSNAVNLLRCMLQKDPAKRIKAKELLTHPWVVGDYRQSIKWQSIYQPGIIDHDCAMEIAIREGTTLESIVQRLQNWNYDYITSTYLILLDHKRKKLPIKLPPKPGAMNKLNTSTRLQLITSPTIHASLESMLDEPNDEEILERLQNVKSPKPQVLDTLHLENETPKDDDSYHTAIGSGLVFLPPLPSDAKAPCKIGERASDLVKALKIRDDGKNIVDDSKYVVRPNSIYVTPAGKIMNRKILTPLQQTTPSGISSMDTPFSAQLRNMNKDTTPRENVTPSSAHTPRSRKRTTPQVAKRMFTSVERKVDRMINLLTPKRARIQEMPAKLAKSRATSKSPEEVINTLINVFQSKGIVCKRKGWTVKGKSTDATGKVVLTVVFEIVYISHLNMVGVKRKRLNGDAWMYKRVCEDVMNSASI
ncbi:Maternal embryonic leucine zipper kinase [Trichinella pseudospiralis]|uniref:non-specific serine/threonine protein kinase n=2 Tax=Trichinella pseudospiralis TaxID=6337 RepID=A0A0V1K3N6_TRIPS|nr:Maternal embryonic leucine zipper kinase [Trichinella pseudospiralis]KRZ19544.1 Maternal embryonic leucine zipper kinase [Trichinella pseudospiralis]KRZ41855.1 Maternal embryonic leucine zipper kinase [Trichinella pseudospiralis]